MAYTMLERFADEIDTMFDEFGLGRRYSSARQGRNLLRPRAQNRMEMWVPPVDITHQNNELVVRADLPGIKREDVCVDVTEHELAISGERREEQKSETGGMYHSERSYGTFYRTIPLPEGALADQAKATFKDGVLEIHVPAPPEHVNRGRRLEIK